MPRYAGYYRGPRASVRSRKFSRDRSIIGRLPPLRYLAPDNGFMKFQMAFTQLADSGSASHLDFILSTNSLRGNPTDTGTPSLDRIWNAIRYAGRFYASYRVHGMKIRIKVTPFGPYYTDNPYNQNIGICTFPCAPTQLYNVDINNWPDTNGSEYVANHDISQSPLIIDRYVDCSLGGYWYSKQEYGVDDDTLGSLSPSGSSPYAGNPVHETYLVMTMDSPDPRPAAGFKCFVTWEFTAYVNLLSRRYTTVEDSVDPPPTLQQLYDDSAPTVIKQDDVFPGGFEELRALALEPVPTPPSPDSKEVPQSPAARMQWQIDNKMWARGMARNWLYEHNCAKQIERSGQAFLEGYVPAMGPMSEVSDDIDVDR